MTFTRNQNSDLVLINKILIPNKWRVCRYVTSLHLVAKQKTIAR